MRVVLINKQVVGVPWHAIALCHRRKGQAIGVLRDPTNKLHLLFALHPSCAWHQDGIASLIACSSA